MNYSSTAKPVSILITSATYMNYSSTAEPVSSYSSPLWIHQTEWEHKKKTYLIVQNKNSI